VGVRTVERGHVIGTGGGRAHEQSWGCVLNKGKGGNTKQQAKRVSQQEKGLLMGVPRDVQEELKYYSRKIHVEVREPAS